MRQFIQLEDGAPKTWPIPATAMQAHAPEGTGFPADCSGCDLREFGFETFVGTTPPAFNPDTQMARETAPIKGADGWTQQWEVLKLSADDKAARDARLLADDRMMTCTPRQMRLALLAAGMLDKVNAAVAAADKVTQVEWEYAATFDRSDPRWDAMGAGIGLKPGAVSALFRAAAAIP